MNLFAVALAIAFPVYILSILFPRSKIRQNGKPLRYPPNTLPLLNNGLIFLTERHKLFSWFVKCENLFGFQTYAISIPSLPHGVVINDPTNIAYVLKNESIFAKGNFFKSRSADLFGNGIINADDMLWKIQRKAGLKFLNNTNLKVLAEKALPKYLRNTVEILKRSHGSIVDLSEMFHEITTQLMGRLAYNMEMHHTDQFTQDFDFVSEVTEERFQNPFWRIKEFFLGNEFRRAAANVANYGALIVSNVSNSRKNNETILPPDDGVESSSGTLIDSLMDVIDDKKIVADAALSFLTAGKDTTGQALSWTFYLLMNNPKKVEMARDHILQILARDSIKISETGSLDTSIFQPSRFPYIMAVFYESLRLFPPVPFELKECQQDITLPDGTYLPKKAIVCWSPWAMNRSRLIWGEETEEFKPERWLVDGMFISRSAFEFPVFNGGPRMCLGKRMAELIAVQVIATLVLDFRFELLDNKERVSRPSFTLPMQGGLPCRASVRN
ncbi:hypothetical protein K3495_g6404 [Podosphaera aphanis]|nr:hypothetical protein K3495_g6404 [Podosphaera aphanis]